MTESFGRGLQNRLVMVGHGFDEFPRADSSFGAGARRFRRGRCRALLFPPRSGNSLVLFDQLADFTLEFRRERLAQHQFADVVQQADGEGDGRFHIQVKGSSATISAAVAVIERMPPQFVGLDRVAGQRHHHRAAESQREDDVQNLLVAEHQHGLVHGGHRFVEAEIRRVAGAQQFGREHVVAFDDLHNLVIARWRLVRAG